MKKCLLPIISLVFIHNTSSAQLISIDEKGPAKKYPFVNTIFNRVFNTGGLDSFYHKLYKLKKTGTGVVSIVHIGDSHIQADYLSGSVRTNLQQFFGNAGRGLVFPYQLAESNAPADVASSSNTTWQYNRLAHPEIPIPAGVSGYCIQSNALGASIDLSLRQNGSDQGFNRLRFFLDSNSTTYWILQTDNENAPILVKKDEAQNSICREIILEKTSYKFSLASIPSVNTKGFYGVSLENSNPGILYHMIGVNGARYEQYNEASLFWEQLPALNADLYIVSLGTNEAQAPAFDQSAFLEAVSTFLRKLKEISPNAKVLLTTAADSYKSGRPNSVLREINRSLSNYANTHNIPVWDLYRISNGYGSCTNWMKRGLMNSDRIHFTGEGYRIQGNLLFNAIAIGYNNFVSTY